jgi:ubiquinone/menaquinone biosynthesis C-methylase UbiE
MTSQAVKYPTEKVSCYICGSKKSTYKLTGQDDLTGIPGNFTYVTCNNCGLIFQNPRLPIDAVKQFYTEDYIAHRKKKSYGPLTPLYNWAMGKHDRQKVSILKKYITLNEHTQVLDVGCAVGSFLLKLNKIFNCQISGVDFKNMTHFEGFKKIQFYLGLFYEQNLPNNYFDLVTMWHFLEHDYAPVKSLKKMHAILKKDGIGVIEVPRLDSVTYALYKERWPGVQAPQHTAIFSKKHFIEIIKKEQFEIVDYLPYGAFPAYFYLYTGLAFRFLKGKGLIIKKHMLPYFFGQLILSPFLLFEKYLNLSMQTAVVKKK